MIVKPESMTFEGKNFVGIIYGSPGTGKTTLALSAPRPLLIDFDGGVSRVKAQHRRDTIMAADYATVRSDIMGEQAKQLLADYDTIIIDTGGSFITALQDWAKAQNPVNKQKNGALSQKGFGAVKQEATSFSNHVKDVLHKNLIYVFHSVEQMDKDGNPIQRLLCEGSFKNICWNWCDFGGYVQMIGNKRVISFSPEQEFFAKGTQGIEGQMDIPYLNPTAPNGFLSRLFDHAKDVIAQEAEAFHALEDQYNSVMMQGYEILATVTDAATATAAVGKLQLLPHALTSKTELSAQLTGIANSLGLKYSKSAGGYIIQKEA